MTAAIPEMRLGIHVVERARLSTLSAAGVHVPEPWMGVLDALRMVEGHLPEPSDGQALGLVGLDALLEAAGADSGPVQRTLRTGFAGARSYFTWKRIPLVLLLDGRVDDARDGSGLVLVHGEHRRPLAPLLGTRLTPARDHVRGWWWAPQIG
jgi:hypothetical protein